jgi:hypothetical protein
MAKNKFITYKLIGIFVSVISYFMLLSTFTQLFFSGLNPAFLLATFLAFACAAYSYCSNYFSAKVIFKQEEISIKWKEWIKANAVVAVIWGFLIAMATSVFLIFKNTPIIQSKIPKELLEVMQAKMFTFQMIVFLLYGIALIVHVIWTFILLGKYKTFFKS